MYFKHGAAFVVMPMRYGEEILAASRSMARAAAARERDSNNVSVYGFAGMSDATRAPDGEWSLSLFI